MQGSVKDTKLSKYVNKQTKKDAKASFQPKGLFPRTENLVWILVPLPVVPSEEPGQGVVFSEGSRALRVGPAEPNVAN